MNKTTFLSILRSKLGILHANEINDIIDEYSGYIDEKIAEGKSEEEAVRDFGNMDDLVSDILDAYKINKEYTSSSAHEKQREGSFTSSLDEFMATASDILNQAMDYLTSLFSSLFKDFSVENLAQLLVIFLVAIILIAIMKIPFFIVENIGSVIIDMILPYRLSRIIVVLWEIVVNVIYFLMALLVIVGLIQGVLDKKDISQSIRDMFRRPISTWKPAGRYQSKRTDTSTFYKAASDPGYEDQTEPQKHSDADVIIRHSVDLPDDELFDVKNEADTAPDSDSNNASLHAKPVDVVTNQELPPRKPEVVLPHSETTPQTQKRSLVQSFLEMIIGLLKVFVLVALLPIYAMMVGIAIAIGGIVYLLFQGISIFGFLLVLLSILGVASTCTGFIWYMLDRKKANRMMSFKTSIISSCVLLGFGGVFSFFDVMRFEYDPTPTVFSTYEHRKNLYFDLSEQPKKLQFATYQISLATDNQLVDNRIKIELKYHQSNAEVNEYEEKDIIHVFLSHYGGNFGEFKFIMDALIDGLKDNTLYNLEQYSNHVVVIHANEATLARMQLRSTSVDISPLP